MNDFCPDCFSNLSFWIGTNKYWKWVGIEVRGQYDGVLFWRCPECEADFHRFIVDDIRHTLAASYIGNRPVLREKA